MARRRRVDRHSRALRERRYRLRGRSQTSRFIPDADSEFAKMSRCFVSYIEERAERMPLSKQQIEKLNEAVEAYRDALAATMRPCSAGPLSTSKKNWAREEAEKAVRSAARILRADPSLDSVDREILNLHEPAKRLKRRECPQIAPVLRYVRTIDAVHAHSGRHVLEYMNDFDNKPGAKPHGAARLELFVELVSPDAAHAGKVPVHPGQLSGGRLWYLKSFSSCRFEVEFPVMADGTPMLVVYWGRWADAKGAVGPFSKTCVARVEGGPNMTPAYVLPGPGRKAYVVQHMPRQIEAKRIVAQPMHALTDQSLDAVEARPMLEAVPHVTCSSSR